MKKYKHHKGNIYHKFSANIINCTNAQDDQKMCLYSNANAKDFSILLLLIADIILLLSQKMGVLLFVREIEEFNDKFS